MDKFVIEPCRSIHHRKSELLRRNTDPEVVEIRVTKRKAKRGEQVVKGVSCSACGCIQHNLYPKVVEQSSYENLTPNKQLRSP